MKRWLLVITVLICLSPKFVSAQVDDNVIPDDTTIVEDSPHSDPPAEEFFRAKVEAITKDETVGIAGRSQRVQNLTLKLLSGPDVGKELDVEHGKLISIRPDQAVAVGQTVVVTRTETPDGPVYYVADKYRLPAVAWLALGFFVLVVVFGRIRGLTSVLGLAVTMVVIISFVIPRILNGANPLMMSLIGAVVIAITSLYLAHGVSRRTTVALVSTLATLGAAVGMAIFATWLAKVNGTGSDEAFYLQLGTLGAVDMKGLFLGGVMIGALGVLDDITTAQAATVDELRKANQSLGMSELYRRGLSVGREHIASLVNTLVLAYTGASFPLLLLFSAKDSIPLWVNLNSEFIVEEIVRTLVGSSALVLAVPLATILAAAVFSRRGGRHA